MPFPPVKLFRMTTIECDPGDQYTINVENEAGENVASLFIMRENVIAATISPGFRLRIVDDKDGTETLEYAGKSKDTYAGRTNPTE